jgi:hypothetical protein
VAGSPNKRDRIDRWLVLAGDPATLRDICDHIVEGGTLREWCEQEDVRYSDVSLWLGAETERRDRYDTARSLRDEWLTDTVIRNLRIFADVDIARAYDDHGVLLPIAEMPEDVRRAIVSIEIDEEQVNRSQVDRDADEGEAPELVHTRTRKIRLVSREKAVELLGKYRKMYVDKVEHSADATLEQLLTKSRETPKPPAIDEPPA